MFANEKEKFENEKKKYELETENLKGDLIQRESQIAKQKEENFIEKNQHKQRIKQVMFQKLDEDYAKRIEIQKKLKEFQDEHEVLENELMLDERALKKEWKEQETSHQGYLYNMKFEKQKSSTGLRDEYERRIFELQKKFKLKNEKIIRDLENKSTALIKDLEGKKKEKILQITGENTRRYKEIENYFVEILTSNLNLIKQLKFEIKKAQRNEDRNKKALATAEEEEKQLQSPLKKIKLNIENLKKNEKEWIKIKEKKRNYRKKIDELKEDFRQLEFEYEVKFQKNQYSNEMLEKLEKAHQESLFQVQQKAGLRNLILRKKIGLTDNGKNIFKGEGE